MLLAALAAFAHHLAAFALFAALVVELVSLGDELTLRSARRLLVADRIYGIAAAAILLVGGARVSAFEKGAAYYAHSGPFLIKIGLFVAIGVLSIYPTMVFLSWRKAVAAGMVPLVDAPIWRRLRMLVHLELTLLALLILCAALAAKGVGFLGA